MLLVPAGDSLQRPRLLKPVPRYLERLSVRLYPSVEEFEEELLDLLNSDRSLQVLPLRSQQGQRRAPAVMPALRLWVERRSSDKWHLCYLFHLESDILLCKRSACFAAGLAHRRSVSGLFGFALLWRMQR